MLKVIEEIGDLPLDKSQRYMEVWNKVDLVQDDKAEAFKEKVEKAANEADFPIVIMSAKTGYNKDLFLE